MPRKLLASLRQNTIALLALFVALGGTSYAAISLPRNSVGARQIRNHTITPDKLNASATGGYVLDWAQIDHVGHVLSSRPRRATTPSWNSTPGSPFIGGSVSWHHPIAKGCFAVASAVGLQTGGPAVPASVSADIYPGSAAKAFVAILQSAPTAVNVAIICPIR